MSTTWIGLRLDPLDTLFFRDGRPFDAAIRASGGLPTPQTLAGAIRTALLARTGFDFAKFAKVRKANPEQLRNSLRDCGAQEGIVDACFRGPWLALESSDKTVSPLLPMPETLKRGKNGGWSVAKPVASVPGWDDPDGLKPLWRTVPADPKADAELLTLAGLRKFLGGNAEGIAPDIDTVKRDDLMAADHRIGIEIDKDTLTSADGMLYAISLLAMRPQRKGQPEVCLYAEIELPTDVAKHLDDTLVPFGGEGKYVKVTTVKEQDWPSAVNATRSMWYLATPTFFPPTGRPLPMVAGLTAAASGAGVPVSGWDVARNGPRATRFAVPAGAVYFVNGDCSPVNFLNADPESDSLRQEGWGFALPGTWEGMTQ
jgi:CRISPR-associated protein Cmr3